MTFCWTAFFPLLSTGEYLLGISQTGLTLENLGCDSAYTADDYRSGEQWLRLDPPDVERGINSNFTILGQNTIEVYGVTGTTEANGNWKFTVIDATHIDLVGSTFTNAYVSGGISVARWTR